jgi:D-alanine-D-alanine ligase
MLMGGISGEREISFLTGKACSIALKKKGYKVVNVDAKGYFVEKLRKLKPKAVLMHCMEDMEKMDLFKVY